MLAWWMLVPTLLAMMVALVLPGFMWLRAGSRSSLVAIGAAPAFTFGLSHAAGRVLTLTAGTADGPVTRGDAASAGVVGGRLTALVS